MSDRCAAWARREEVDPVGTAGSWSAVLVVDWPRPWPSDVGAVQALAAVVEAAHATRTRLIAAVPLGGPRRVTLHALDLNRATAGRSTTRPCETSEGTVGAALALLNDPSAGEPGPRELLVCTHGRRDVCCGSLGTGLVRRLGAAVGDAVVRECSHLGGHRFAPTVLVLPEGTSWAFADEELVEQVACHTGDASTVLDRYRGNIALVGPPLQALERAAFAELGWAWLAWERDGAVHGDVVSVRGRPGTGPWSTWHSTWGDGRRLPVPTCGLPAGAAAKTESEIVLGPITRRGAGPPFSQR